MQKDTPDRERHRDRERHIWKKNDTAVIRIEDIAGDGEGIGHADGYAVFVKDTVPGDLAEIRIVKAGKQFGYGRLLRLLEPSAYRTAAVCPVAGRCGGCQLQMMRYEEQLRWKERKVRGDLERIGGLRPRTDGTDGLEGLFPEPVSGMEDPFRYRNKALFPVGTGRDGSVTAGFYAGRTHVIVPCEDCLLGAKENSRLLKAVTDWAETCHVRPYDETTGKGLVRHVLIRKGFRTGKFHVCLVINGKKVPEAETLIQNLRQAAPDALCGISFSRNTARGNAVMGERAEAIWGSAYLTDTLRSDRYDISVTYQISPNSFYQVNPVMTERMYEKVLAYADPDGSETVADLYCGIGTISLFLAGRVRRVYGVEIIPEAVRDARENAKLNGISNAEFFVGKAEEVMPRLHSEGAEADIVIVDPPRKGCDGKLLETIADMNPKKLIYVSCNPATLARDLRWLSEHGFRLDRYQAFDQFPMTVHVETVCLLRNNNTKPNDCVGIGADGRGLLQD